MSCQLPQLASFQDIKGVKKLLFPKDGKDEENDNPSVLNPSEEGAEASSWDEADWGWKDEEDEEKGNQELSKQDKDDSLSWLQECCVSVSPTAEFMAIAHDEQLVVLSQKWDPHEKSDVQTKYVVTYEGNLCDDDEVSVHDTITYKANKVACASSEKITALLCLPLASQKKSTHGGPDWTCILVGFSSGYVKMYTENGSLLLAQIFSEDPVQQIRCRTYERPRHTADAEKHEELTILYKKALVTIDGFSFFQSLRACRNQVARAAASGAEQIQPPPLAYKKYGLKDQERIKDHVTCGMITPNPFDQMVTGSMLGGYTASIKSTPPASHLYVTAGVQPCAGFYHAVEGSAQPMLSDVAHAVASKLKNAFFSHITTASGWLGLGGKTSQDNHREKKKPKIEPATTLASRFGLPDKRRHGEIICLSPDNKMAAMTDSFGRVMLLDIVRGVALRMWKGYREAQVGWIQVKEDAHEGHSSARLEQRARHALFLVIYAPRRGILEVWASQQGSRVAAFNISRNCQLVCPGHGLMGLNNVTSKNMKAHIYQCFLIDPEDGVRTIDVPFHLILSEKNSKRARDMHLLKKLKVALKEGTAETDGLETEVCEILNDIRMASIRNQGVVKILHTKYLTADFIMNVLMSVTQHIEAQAQVCATEEEVATLDYDSRMLLQFCKTHMRLIDNFVTQEKFNASPPAYEESDSTDEELQKCLGLTGEELQGLRNQMENYHRVALTDEPHVQFQVKELSIGDFLSCFDCQTLSVDTDRTTTICNIVISPTMSDAKKCKLGDFLFRKVLTTGWSTLFEESLKSMCLSAEDLMDLLLYVWLFDDNRQAESARNLNFLVKSISQLKGGDDLSENINQVSPWWQRMRDKLSCTENISSAYIAALVCRAVSIELHNDAKIERQMTSSTDSASIDLSDWENVTMDRTQWTIAVRQLEDLLELQCLLKMKPVCRSPGAIATGEVEVISVSVAKIQDDGRGVIPELVAKWIAGNGISPSMLCLVQEDESLDSSKVEAGQEVTEEKKPEQQNPIVARLQVIQKRLPHSLDADTLMANCAWEYILRWNKDVEVIFSLEQAVDFLKCIQNSLLQHGIAAMMWQMFVCKKLSSTAHLVEKVGKCPKERLCRKDVGMSDTALRKLTDITCDLLETMIQVAYSKGTLARQESRSAPVMNTEDIWAGIQGPTSLVELAIDQKEANCELVEHHYSLCVMLHAVFTFSMRGVKLLSFFDSKGKSAFFKPLHSTPTLPSRIVDDALLTTRRQFLCKIIHHAVVSLGGRPASQDEEASVNDSLSLPLSAKNTLYSRWPAQVLNLARQLGVDLDAVRRHHVCELYSSGLEKLAEEVLLTVSDHSVMGSQLMLISGQRLNHYISTSDKEGGVDKLANCPPNVSAWIKSLDPSQLRCPGVPLKDTAALIGQAVNQLPEGHSDYNMAIALVDLVQSLM